MDGKCISQPDSTIYYMWMSQKIVQKLLEGLKNKIKYFKYKKIDEKYHCIRHVFPFKDIIYPIATYAQ